MVWTPVQNIERRGGPVVTFQPEESLEETIDNLKGRGVEVPAGISDHP